EEQRLGQEVDARADVYALGRVLHEVLTKTSTSEVPPELEVLCTRACEADVARRLASARELGEGVQRYLDGDRDLALRQKLAREHLARAKSALSADDSQATAMREAGRALALDPELAEASQLVGRMMLEPPKQLPTEAERMFASTEDEAR